MKAVVFEQCGEPGEVLRLHEVPMPRPQRGQVRVRMLASPINPSDLLFIRGRYGAKPRLPATPGFEGVGVVEESGGGFLGWRVRGQRVAVLNGITGNWQEQTIIPAHQAIPLPDYLPDEQAASFLVNPATALVMVRDVLRVPRGAWLLQTAAGSALGRMLIRLARLDGFHTLNVVRRAEQVAELKQLGGDEVVVSGTGQVVETARKVTAGRGVPFAVDAVGGDTGAEALDALATRGRLLVYGALSEQAIPVHPRSLIVGSKLVEGFWLKDWMDAQSLWTKFFLMKRLAKLIRDGVLATPPGEVFPLERVQEAVRLADTVGRGGKVLLRIGQANS